MLWELLRLNSLISLVIVLGDLLFTGTEFSELGWAGIVGDFLFVFMVLAGPLFVGMVLWHGRPDKLKRPGPND